MGDATVSGDGAAITTEACPYKGDGLAGWGKLMEGFARSHGKIEETGCTTTDQNQHDLKKLTQDVVTEYTKEITHLTGAQRECLINSIATACEDYNNNIWTDQKAKDDVQDITEALFKQFKETTVPTLLNKQCTHGLYNDTSTQLIIDRAYSEVQDKATALTLDNINKYFANYQQLGSTLIGFIQQGINDTMQEEFDQLQDTDQEEDNTSELDSEVCRDLKTQHSISMTELALDMGPLIIASAVIESVLHRKYCGDPDNPIT